MEAAFVAVGVPGRGSTGTVIRNRWRARGVAMGLQVPFQKYQGTGNDFVLIDNRSAEEPVIPQDHSVAVCDRHFGVGADGVIFLMPPQSSATDYTMRIFNSDGSEPEMCGNGIRCLAKFASALDDHKKNSYRIDTLGGVMVIEITDGQVRVDMGEPELDPAKVPSTLAVDEKTRRAQYEVDGRRWEVVPVGTGNPHAVIFVTAEEFAALDGSLEAVGPRFEQHEAFPARTNTEFIHVKSAEEIDFLVWERGAGRTLACGTGACASVVAGVVTGELSRSVKVNLPGGVLQIEWREEDNHMYMTGPAELVFSGELELP